MLIQDSESDWQEPDDGNVRLSLMAAALAVAAFSGALYAQIQALLA